MRARPSSVSAIAAAVLAGLAVTALSAPPNALPTSASKRPEKAEVKSYPVYDARGRRTGSAKWRVTKAGGNCCEVLVTTTRTGRIIEFGGTYPVYSDDRGLSWTEIAPLVPSTSKLPNPGPKQIAGGEGTVVQAPGGDILGIGWDPYSGDRLQSFFYSAKEKKWSYNEAPLHEPFYDREWVAVAKGPITIAGTTYPWVSLVLSNSNRTVVLMSTDGLNYFTPTQRDLDALRNPAVRAYLPVKPDPDLDYMQEQAQTGMAALSQGALSFDDTASNCKTQILTAAGSWSCFTLPNEVELRGPLHTDSRGWLHEVYADGSDVVYRLSKDGGRRWTERTFTFPGSPSLSDRDDATWDFKVNGRLGVAVVAAHARKANGTFQDMVMKIDVRTPTPRLDRTYFVGAGDMRSEVGVLAVVSGTERVDFTSVAILPDGKIVASFADAKFTDPAVAILL